MSIYIRNLAWSITRDDLFELFSQYGEVRYARVCTDLHTGHSRGIGFVTMARDGDAMNAIEQLNGAEWAGRILLVERSTNTRSARGVGRGQGHRLNLEVSVL
jgi:RNA recognition motif-containing protein